jgi:hypothetical protein
MTFVVKAMPRIHRDGRPAHAWPGRRAAVGDAPEAMHVVLIALALPFLWIGLSMSVRS